MPGTRSAPVIDIADDEHEVLTIGRSRPGCVGQESAYLVLWDDRLYVQLGAVQECEGLLWR